MRRINLNLAPALRALLRERSVSKAADALGLTQSGASAALRRLRLVFDDPLLVQVGQRMELTRRAQDLVEPLEQMFLSLEQLLRPVECEPASLKRTFKIWTVDFSALQIATRLLPELAETAPGVTLQFVHAWPPSAEEVLRSGDADIAITPARALDLQSPSVATEPLYWEQMVVVVPATHPLAAHDELTVEDLARHAQVTFQEGLLEWSNAQRYSISGQHPGTPIAAHLQQLSLLPVLAAKTNTIAITTLMAAQQFADLLPVQIRELPGKPWRQEIRMAWSTVHTFDPVHRWMRQLIVKALQDVSLAPSKAV